MSIIIYDSASLYVQSKTTLKERLAAYQRIQTALIKQLEAMADNPNINIQEYSLDDGQTKIKTVYKNQKDIELSLDRYEGLIQRLLNQLNGRMTRLVDGKNFYNYNKRR